LGVKRTWPIAVQMSVSWPKADITVSRPTPFLVLA